MRKFLWEWGPGLLTRGTYTPLYLLVTITVGAVFLRTLHDIALYVAVCIGVPIALVVLAPIMFTLFWALDKLWDKLLPDQAEKYQKK